LRRAASTPTITIRQFQAADERPVLELLNATLGGGPAGRRPPDFFRWKHWDNPFGPSFMLVAESAGRLVGLRAFMRWRFEASGRTIEAVRAVDTATHPDHQGLGVFSRLTRAALEELQDQVELIFNTPNSSSLPGYLKLGWREVGRLPVGVRIRQPLRLARALRAPTGPRSPRPRIAADSAARVLEWDEQVVGLLAEVQPGYDGRLRTPRDLAYLRWRYGRAPLLDYAAVAEEEGGRYRGLAIFRVRPRSGAWEATIAELLVPSGDRRTARRLLRRVAAAAPVDHLTLRAPEGTALAAAAAGFLPAPRGIRFVVRVLGDPAQPDPTHPRAWALSLGDVEVF
jgi:GNAT superfamily N-acetyltransferase